MGLIGVAMTTATSCSDDDDCNNGIVYNQHSFDKAYTLEETQSFFKSLDGE